MKRALNITLYILAIGVVAGIAGVIITNKSLPEGEEGPEAEALIDSMHAAINLPAWERLRYLKWTFTGSHHYVWDKLYNLAEVRFGKYRVVLHTNKQDGYAWKNGIPIEGNKKKKIVARAWKYWCNDSFWLNAPAKIRDDGTLRKLVELEDGNKGILVTYLQGGTTPGDSYLWILDENYRPVAWRMWVKILPIKGLKATWEDWVNVDAAWFSQKHKIGPMPVDLTGIVSGDHHSELGLDVDPFTDF